MKRWIYTYRLVSGDPAALERTMLARSRELLQLATAAPDEPVGVDGSFVVDLEVHLAGLDLGKHVRVTTGVARRAGNRVLLPITWHAEPARLAFPILQGNLELETLDHHVVQVSLVGSYRVPLGPVGALLDATVLRDVAQRSSEHLLDGLVRELQRAVGSPEPVIPSHIRAGVALRVRDVMTDDPLVLDPDMPLRTAALLLFYAEVSGAPVMGADDELIGVLSERDLLAKEADLPKGFSPRGEDRRREARTVGDACSRPARCTVPDARLSAAAREMLDHDVSRLVVIDGGRVVGIITRHDVLAGLVRGDADILTAVQVAMAGEDIEDLQIEVRWGEVRITGTVDLRSAAIRIREAVADVDGVMAVDDRDLAWETDDLVPTMVPFA
jgi:CBS domain-containing protein